MPVKHARNNSKILPYEAILQLKKKPNIHARGLLTETLAGVGLELDSLHVGLGVLGPELIPHHQHVSSQCMHTRKSNMASGLYLAR